jgi:hypothetical protein
MEQWRAIPGWEGFYEVSDMGRVRSLDRIVRCGNGHKLSKGRIKATPLVKGYRRVALHRENEDKQEYVHRFVLMAFRGMPEPGMEACHNNGNRLDNTLANLRWDTLASNKRDMVTHGNSTKGERNPSAKLNRNAVQALRRDREALGLTYRELAEKYGISASVANEICLGRLWA